MIPRKDALLNPYLRKHIVCSLYRKLLKNSKGAFDPMMKELIAKEISKFKR